MGTSTTAIFTAVGIDPTTISAFLQFLYQAGLNFAIYMVETAWPFLLVIGLFLFFWGIGSRWLHIGSR